MDINILKFVSVLIFYFSASFCGFSQILNHNIFTFKLPDDQVLHVQICTNDICRIRVTKENSVSQSLLERYAIVRTVWDSVPVQLIEKGETQILQTLHYRLTINTYTGEFTFNKFLPGSVEHIIQFHKNKSEPDYEGFQQSMDTYFEADKRPNRIIGDSVKETITACKPISKYSLHPSLFDISLATGERFYGGGSTSRSKIQHRGEALRMWATYKKTEIPMPFLMSSDGWGIYNNTTSLNYFDIDRYKKNNLFVYNTDGVIDFYVIFGNTMDEVINQFTNITGKPYLLPKWAYGLAFGGNTKEDQFGILNDAVKFREEKIPCDIFWLEPQWMAKNYDFSTSKNWNLDKFSAEPFWEVNNFPKYEAPTLFISKLHQLGFKLALWLCVDHDLSIEEEDYLAKQSGTAQSGLEHWFPHLTKFMDQGVDGFKLDPGRTLDEHPDRKYYNGYTDKEMHNLNQILLQKQMYTVFKEHKGLRSFHHYCGGYAGTQHWGASTSGDNGGGKDALFDQLNLGLSGFLNTSADVLEGIDNNKAGMHLGFFLPWVQINSWYSLHHPWYLKPLEKETFRYYAQLRNSLLPYIYSAAIYGSQTGMPILRAMPLSYPDDRNVDHLIYQYMFGESLLVGVFSDSIYLPKGKWINYWTGEIYYGEQIVHCNIPDNRGGLLFIKSGAIIPFQKSSLYINEYSTDTLIVKVYPEKESSYSFFEDDGISFDYEKGIYAKTIFECNKFNRKIKIKINKKNGVYSNMIQKQTYLIKVFDRKPLSVKMNSHHSTNWKYSKDAGCIELLLSQTAKQSTEIEFIY